MIQFLADNQSLITREKQHLEYSEPYPNHTLKAEFDLTEQIYQTIQEADIQASFYHVKGHQDSLGRQLTRLETLNCLMDHNAKLYARYKDSGVLPPLLPAPSTLGFGTITCGSTLVTSKLQTTLYNIITRRDMLRWMGQHSEIQAELEHLPIAWLPFACARKQSTLSINIFITKLIGGDLPTG